MYQHRPHPRAGLMQNPPLLIASLLEFAANYHGDREIVSKMCPEDGGQIHRTTYREARPRCKRLANALMHELGVVPGDCIGTLASNHYRHFELYYAVSGIGAILHTLNPRYSLEQLEYIVNHGEDKIIFVDHTFRGVLVQLMKRGNCKHIEKIVLMTDEEHFIKGPDVLNSLCYESLLARHSAELLWPFIDENQAAALCYTSGTTGHPKGVLYSQRSTMLHTMMQCSKDSMGICSGDSILVVVPLYHVSGWGLPYAAAMTGAKLVFPGPVVDGAVLSNLLISERCNVTAAVPTVWLTMLEYLDKNEALFQQIDWKALRIFIGGSAPPRALLQRFVKLGANPVQLWGMTELSPIGSVCNPLPKHAQLQGDALLDLYGKAGRPPFGVELEILDDRQRPLPHDGKSAGNLVARGPWVTRQYFRQNRPNVLADEWFPTGDVATMDADGFVSITDRSKDVVKSGGEWISSIDLENAAMSHPSLSSAAVIGVSHPTWQERPLLVVVLKEGAQVTAEEILDVMRKKIPKWWMPDAVEFIDAMPLTATGKISKVSLREKFKGYTLKSSPSAKHEEPQAIRAKL